VLYGAEAAPVAEVLAEVLVVAKGERRAAAAAAAAAAAVVVEEEEEAPDGRCSANSRAPEHVAASGKASSSSEASGECTEEREHSPVSSTPQPQP
jgi:hypothetical protein